MPGTFSLPSRVSDPDSITARASRMCRDSMPGSLSSGFLWSWWQGKRSWHSRRKRNLQLYVSGKRPMVLWSRFALLKSELSRHSRFLKWSWAPPQYKDRLFYVYGFHVLKTTQSWERLFINMGIPMLVRWYLYIETAPMFRSDWINWDWDMATYWYPQFSMRFDYPSVSNLGHGEVITSHVLYGSDYLPHP